MMACDSTALPLNTGVTNRKEDPAAPAGFSAATGSCEHAGGKVGLVFAKTEQRREGVMEAEGSDPAVLSECHLDFSVR